MPDEARPHYGQRKSDRSRRAKANAFISEWKAIIMLAFALLGGLGIRISWIPAQEIKANRAELMDSVSVASRKADLALARLDSASRDRAILVQKISEQSAVLDGLGRQTCLTTPLNDLRRLNLPCQRLLQGATP